MKLEADFEEVPEDAVFEYGISIVVYLDVDVDGAQRYGIMAQGNMNGAGVIGVLELAKQTVMRLNDRT